MTPHKHTLLTLGMDGALQASCVTALTGHTEVFDESDPDRPRRPDFVLTPIRDPLPACIERFVALRRTQPDVPILLCGADLSAEVVAELLKAGAVDFVGLPLVPEVLRRKLDRARTGRYALALDDPAFAPLRTQQDEQAQGPGFNNRRGCFRVPVPAHLAVAVTSPKLGAQVRLPVEDLSVPMDGQAGGMRLRADAAVVARLLALGAEVPVSIHLPGEAHPLAGQIHLLRMAASTGAAGSAVMLGVRYRLAHQRDEEKLERLWMQCQRLFKAAEARAARG